MERNFHNDRISTRVNLLARRLRDFRTINQSSINTAAIDRIISAAARGEKIPRGTCWNLHKFPAPIDLHQNTSIRRKLVATVPESALMGPLSVTGTKLAKASDRPGPIFTNPRQSVSPRRTRGTAPAKNCSQTCDVIPGGVSHISGAGSGLRGPVPWKRKPR